MLLNEGYVGGACGGSMTILTRKTKNGGSYAQFVALLARLVRAHERRTISEQKVTRALLDALHDTLNHPEVVQDLVDTASRRIAAVGRHARWNTMRPYSR